MSIQELKEPLLSYFLTQQECSIDILQEEIKKGKKALVFMAPFPMQIEDEMSANVKLTGKDGRFYVLERIFKALGISLESMQTRKLTWSQVLKLNPKLNALMEKDRRGFPGLLPATEERLKHFLVGNWTMLVISTDQANLQPLQSNINSIKGKTIPYQISTEEPEYFINWHSSVSVSPLRYVLGDLTAKVENDRQFTFSIRYNCIHIPDDADQAVFALNQWKEFKDEI